MLSFSCEGPFSSSVRSGGGAKTPPPYPAPLTSSRQPPPAPCEPVNPNATPEARALLKTICAVAGKLNGKNTGPCYGYYPGARCVDILASGIYGKFEQSRHDGLLELARGKPIALGEIAFTFFESSARQHVYRSRLPVVFGGSALHRNERARRLRCLRYLQAWSLDLCRRI